MTLGLTDDMAKKKSGESGEHRVEQIVVPGSEPTTCPACGQDVPGTLARRARALRKAFNWTRKEVEARPGGPSESTQERAENGKRGLGRDAVEAYARAYNSNYPTMLTFLQGGISTSIKGAAARIKKDSGL